MGRKKDPEQTVERILNVSTELFMEKGYERTSIQDILEKLNLSKGGLYHHFTSKEEILEAVLEKRRKLIYERMQDYIQNMTGENAKEKLKKILYHLLTDSEMHLLDVVVSSQIKNPYFVVDGIQNCIKVDARIIGNLIADGVQDGLIPVENPEFCAEVFLLLFNFWINPVLFEYRFSDTKERLYYLKAMMEQLGLDVIDEDLINFILQAYQRMGIFSLVESKDK